jgi:hypothetical protein
VLVTNQQIRTAVVISSSLVRVATGVLSLVLLCNASAFAQPEKSLEQRQPHLTLKWFQC